MEFLGAFSEGSRSRRVRVPAMPARDRVITDSGSFILKISLLPFRSVPLVVLGGNELIMTTSSNLGERWGTPPGAL